MKINDLKPINEKKYRNAFSVFKMVEKDIDALTENDSAESSYIRKLYHMLLLDFRYHGSEQRMSFREWKKSLKNTENELVELSMKIGPARSIAIEEVVYGIVLTNKKKLEMN